MPHALQRRLARLFPQGNDTAWLDCRNGHFRADRSLPVAIVGLDFLAAAHADNLPLPAATLILDMDDGADLEDVLRSGSDGVLCSEALTWALIAKFGRQCREWNYPLIADCRSASPQGIRRFFSTGAHAALLRAEQVPQSPFKYNVSQIVTGTLF